MGHPPWQRLLPAKLLLGRRVDFGSFRGTCLILPNLPIRAIIRVVIFRVNRRFDLWIDRKFITIITYGKMFLATDEFAIIEASYPLTGMAGGNPGPDSSTGQTCSVWGWALAVPE
jgi:hypothetical protein